MVDSEASKISNQTPLYLPKKSAVKSVTLGYEHFVSTVLWFSTLNYFGEKFIKKDSMPWFNHMCDLVTDLDPKARHVYEFCGTLLSWIAKEPENSNIIMTKAIKDDPNYWRYYYLRGFNNWYFLNDLSLAKSDFEAASQKPDAPSFLVSMASRLMVHEGDEESAIAFLKASYVRTSDPSAKQAIAEKLNLAVVARDIRILKEAVQVYKNQHANYPKSLQDLIDLKLIKEIPTDPFGEAYVFDVALGTIRSTKGGEGLAFKGKTAAKATGETTQTSQVSDVKH